MRIALITPHYYPAVRGNAITVRRVERHLGAGGCDTKVFSVDAQCAEEIVAGIRLFSPDLIHAFHGYLGGRIARLAAQSDGVPYVVTLTGTDLYETVEDRRRSELVAVCEGAAALVTFDRSMKQRMSTVCPAVMEKITIVPQGVELPEKGESGVPSTPGERRFFLPAGLRPVKNVLFPLVPLAELHREEPGLRFLVAGPVLDSAYAAKVLGRFDEHSFAHYLGEIGHNSIRSLYEAADVVLCTSLFEGGMPNSILEALALGRPVLAAAIEGNLSLIKEGETGLLYRTEAEFLVKARQLLRDPSLRQQLGEQGQRFVLGAFAPEKEAAGYLELYRQVIGGMSQMRPPPIVLRSLDSP